MRSQQQEQRFYSVTRTELKKTIGESLESYIPRIMSGIMSRDWSKTKGAIVQGAIDYLSTHLISENTASIVRNLEVSPQQHIVITALLTAIECENIFGGEL